MVLKSPRVSPNANVTPVKKTPSPLSRCSPKREDYQWKETKAYKKEMKKREKAKLRSQQRREEERQEAILWVAASMRDTKVCELRALGISQGDAEEV